MKMLIVGIVLASVASAGLIVTLVLRFKALSAFRRTGIRPGIGNKLAVTAGGLLSIAVLALSVFLILSPRSGTRPLVWNPEMEKNPLFDLKKTSVHPALSRGKVIKEATVFDKDQRVDLGPVTVTIPPGTLGKPEAASSREPPGELSPPFGPVAGSLAFVDIKIGDMTQFKKPLTLQFPIKAAGIDPDLPPERQFYVACFDEKDLAWKRVPFTVDAATQTLSVTTDHLTVYWIGNLFSLDGKHCTVYFLPSEMRAVNRKYETETGITSQERLPLSIIRDMAFFVDTAYESYSLPDTALPMPAYKIDVLAFLGSNASWFEKKKGGGETYTGTWSGTININCDAISTSTDMMEVLRNDCAHELFHLVQREKYGCLAMDMYNFSQSYFWLDAAAEYSASTLAWRTSATRHGRKLGPTMANVTDLSFLQETLVSNKDPHRYQAARFIEYLMTRHGLKATALLDIPQQDSTFSVSFDKYMSTLDPELTLIKAYDDFSSFFVFDPKSSRAMDPGGMYLDVKKYFSGTLLKFKDGKGNIAKPVMEMDQTLTGNGKYTSDMTCFRPDMPCKITLSVQMDGRYVSAGVFPKESGKPKKVETAFKDNPATFSVDAQETLVLLFTPLSASQSVPVHIKAQLPTARLQVKVVDAKTSSPVSAKVKVTAGPGETIEKTGDSVVFQDIPAGDVQLAVSAKGYDSKSASVSIDPGSDRSIDYTVRLEPTQTSTASFIIKVQDAKTGNAIEARVVVTSKAGGKPITRNGSNLVFDGLVKGNYTVSVAAKGYKVRSEEFTINPDKLRENKSVCKLEREQEQKPAPKETPSTPTTAKTMDPQSFDRMLKQRHDELDQLCREVQQIWNKQQDCCSNPSHTGTPPDGSTALTSVQKFSQCQLGCRNCGMKFSARETKRPNGKTYAEHYRERVEYYDKLLQQAPPDFWKIHEYEKYGGLNIIKKK